jgi:hypothetical protein
LTSFWRAFGVGSLSRIASTMCIVGKHVEMAPLPYDLRIGVTGHRELADSRAVADAVRRILENIRTALKPSPEVPLNWTIVSPLATGADQIVAREVLQLANARLEVVTPFPLATYRRDFASPDALSAFEMLLARADIVYELDDRMAERDLAYLRVGRQVVDTCELVIAVWNGHAAEGTGGTGDIVEYAVGRHRKVIWVSTAEIDGDPTLLIAKKGESVETRPFPMKAGQLSPGYTQQRDFVTSCIPASRRQPEVQSAQQQFGQPVATGNVLCWFVCADLLAQTYQRRHIASVNAVLYFAGTAISIAVAQVSFLADRHWLALLEALAMSGALAAWIISRRQGWHRKWLQDRYIAERLRATMFLAFLGRRSSPSDNDPLPYYPGPDQWTRRVCARLDASLPRAADPIDKAAVVGRWLDDQRQFHAKTADRTHRRVRLRRAVGLVLFAVTLVMALVHAADGNALIVFLALVLPVWAGVVHGATVQLELERVTARSLGMARALDLLIARADAARTGAELDAIIDEATGLIATEAREWWTLLSFQDVQLHV